MPFNSTFSVEEVFGLIEVAHFSMPRVKVNLIRMVTSEKQENKFDTVWGFWWYGRALSHYTR